ncbi:MAG TPA: TolC family protein, partial [bacterium]|nr:TolC family protein [bacterium]
LAAGAQAAAPAPGATAAPTLPVVSIQQSIDEALANGDDNHLLVANLELSRSQHLENVSKNSWGLNGSAGAGYNLPGGDAGVLTAKQSSLSSITSTTQGAQVGVGVGNPLTSVAVSVSPWSPSVVPYGTTVPGPSGDSYGAWGLNLTQTLWNGYPGGPTQATVDKSLLALQGRQLSTDSGRLAIIYRVKQAYYAVLTAQQNLDVTRQIADKQDALLAQIQAIYSLKQASDVDLKTAQINARSAHVDVENADHGLRISRIQLALLMGRPADSTFSVVPPPSTPLPASSLSDATSLALAHRVDFQQLELSRKSNQVDLALARGQATPTVSVSGGVSQYVDYSTRSAWLVNAGVKVAMPILDAGAVKNLVDAAQKQDEIFQVQERQLQKSIAATIQSDWENIQIVNERVEVARLTAENDDMLVEVYRIQNQNGAASTQDLLTASVNAASAHTAYVQAQSNAQLAALQLLSDMGY